MAKLDIELTREQAIEMSDFWTEYGSFGGAMFAQPRLRWDEKNELCRTIRFGMFSPKEALRIQKVLNRIMAARKAKKEVK